MVSFCTLWNRPMSVPVFLSYQGFLFCCNIWEIWGEVHMTHTVKPVDWGLCCSAEKLAKFDSSQVCSEMPCFKRQKRRRSLSLVLLCVPLCVWYFYLVIFFPPEPRLSFQSVIQTSHLPLCLLLLWLYAVGRCCWKLNWHNPGIQKRCRVSPPKCCLLGCKLM